MQPLLFTLGVFGLYTPLPKPGLFLLKKALTHSKEEYFVSGCLQQDEVLENVLFCLFVCLFFHLEKNFQHQGFAPLIRRKSPDPHFQSFWLSSVPIFENGYRLVGLVVMASASRVEGPRFESRLRPDFSGVKSYR